MNFGRISVLSTTFFLFFASFAVVIAGFQYSQIRYAFSDEAFPHLHQVSLVLFPLMGKQGG